MLKTLEIKQSGFCLNCPVYNSVCESLNACFGLKVVTESVFGDCGDNPAIESVHDNFGSTGDL